MVTIALVGGDGAGKTTLADALRTEYPMPIKYIYMGASAASSNIALPTTRLVWALKVRKARKASRARGEGELDESSLHGIQHRRDKRGRLLATARLLNRIAEAVMRQLVSWAYQARGYVVLFDRHFLFEFTSAGIDQRRFTERAYLWFLEKAIPQPHLTLFLDAPADVLLARKEEVPAHYLEGRRQAYLERGARVSNFVVIDAGQTPAAVYDDAAAAITAFLDARRSAPGRLLSRLAGRG
jgi:thymidylate kinase